MAELRDALRMIADAVDDGEDFVRGLARALDVAAGGRIADVVARLDRAAGGDLTALMSSARTACTRRQWADIVEALGGARSTSWDALAAELDGIADAYAASDDEEDDDPDDDAPLSDDVFRFDADASRQAARDYQAQLTAEIERTLRAAPPGRRFRITVATGGGKTRIANDWIWQHALPRRARVLWVTKDWPLLRQAASDLCRRYQGAARRIGYVGTQGRAQLAGLDEDADRAVVYTTIHTWRSRADADFADAEFDVVVIDESHWGEGKQAYRDLIRRYRSRAVFLGLTATPREGTGFALIGEEYGYARLARMGVLAKHITTPAVRTGVRWSPTRSSTHGDFDRASLSKLARSPKRNRCIRDTYVAQRTAFGKTLVFACDVEHAEALRALFAEQSVAVEALHSHMSADDQRRVTERFRDGRTRVLVNVAMMTHGIDIPDIETVFLARPTASRILFAQMVGRAARTTETKTHFRLVDFVDNLDQHGDVLVSPQQYFGDLDETSPVGNYRRPPRRRAHAFEPAKFQHVPRVEGFDEIAGFDLRPGQTFGIEFELTRDDFEHGVQPGDWMRVARELLDAIPVPDKAPRPYSSYHDPDKDHAVWNVEWDSSCGWEVTSRVLEGAGGFFEVVEVCRALDTAAARLGLRVDKRTGTHVHLAWKADPRALSRLMALTAHHESALYTLVAPSRSGNRFCNPVRGSLQKLAALRTKDDWAAYFAEHDRRYLAVNPSNLFGDLGTLEVRLHSGTLEGPKILGWISLWMRMLDVAEGTKALPRDEIRLRDLPLEASPRGDVRVLATLVGAERELLAHLERRRNAVMERWIEHAQHGERARELMRRWYGGDGAPPSA